MVFGHVEVNTIRIRVNFMRRKRSMNVVFDSLLKLIASPSSSIGMAKAALEAMNGFNLYGDKGASWSVVYVDVVSIVSFIDAFVNFDDFSGCS